MYWEVGIKIGMSRAVTSTKPCRAVWDTQWNTSGDGTGCIRTRIEFVHQGI